MPGFWAHAELLATRIGEKPMSGKTATCARADQLKRRLGAQQMDLFGSPAMHGGNAPAWQELPRETQAVLVNLMTQLMLEHAQRQASATATVEASHDR
jgi:hypothetical protein